MRTQTEDIVLSQGTESVETSTGQNPTRSDGSADYSSDILLNATLAALKDEKAEEIISVGLHDKSQIADFMVICSGRSSRQVSAIAEKLADVLKQRFGIISRIEGKDQGDWALIDAGDVIVHIFRPEVREFYQLEKLWMDPGQIPAKD